MISGALLLDKPVGLSSNAALQRAKRLFAARKAGHAGTLDPLASGLLVVLFGEATKFAGPLLDADKEYLARVKLGERTATGDAEGEVLERRRVQVSDAQLAAVLARFRGSVEQLPPMYSALKREGVPLYKLARRGETVERAARQVVISRLGLVARDGDLVELTIRCSKGTYVRTLAEDIGEALGTGAHLAGLRRAGSGRFKLEDAIALDALERMTPGERQRRLLPLDALLSELPRVQLDAAGEARLRNGRTLEISGLRPGLCAVYGADGGLIGLGTADAAGALRPRRLTQTAEKHQ